MVAHLQSQVLRRYMMWLLRATPCRGSRATAMRVQATASSHLRARHRITRRAGGPGPRRCACRPPHRPTCQETESRPSRDRVKTESRPRQDRVKTESRCACGPPPRPTCVRATASLPAPKPPASSYLPFVCITARPRHRVVPPAKRRRQDRVKTESRPSQDAGAHAPAHRIPPL